MMMNIEFFPADHTFRLDGVPVESVTTILQNEGLIDTSWFKKSGTERGTLVHEATEALDRGDLTLADFEDEEFYPYLEAWHRFREESGYTCIGIESKVASKEYQYAGILDRVMETPKGEFAIIDIKTGAHCLWHGFQLAAYKIALWETLGMEVSFSRVVHLKSSGKYSICARDTQVGSFDNPVWETDWRILVSARRIKALYGKGAA